MSHLDSNDLAAWIDGGLDQGSRSRVESHLAECAECRARLAAQVRAGSTMDAFARSSRKLPAILLLAAVLAALLLGFGLYRVLESDRAPATAEREAAPPDEATGDIETPAATEAFAGGELAADSEAAAKAEGIVDRRTPPSEEPGREAARVAPPEAVPPENGVDPSLFALRGATRRVDGKVFRLRDGAWVDDAHRASRGREPIDLPRGSEAYAAALSAHPEIARFAEVGPTVVVVIDSIAYRILPEPWRPVGPS
ncbi:MAG: zf-HC2 domain-containing protein [Gemmatimonadota bacterium]